MTFLRHVSIQLGLYFLALLAYNSTLSRSSDKENRTVGVRSGREGEPEGKERGAQTHAIHSYRCELQSQQPIRAQGHMRGTHLSRLKGRPSACGRGLRQRLHSVRNGVSIVFLFVRLQQDVFFW